MDPKNQLDPKLKEAYERVMSVNTTPRPQSPPPPQNQPPMSSYPPTPQPSPVGPNPSPLGESGPIVAPKPQGYSANDGAQGPMHPKKPRKKLSFPIVVLGMIIFFIVYTFVWIKIFNVSLPFFQSGTNNPTSGANKSTQTVSPAPSPTQPVISPTVEQPTSAPTIPVAPTQPPATSAGSTTIITTPTPTPRI